MHHPRMPDGRSQPAQKDVEQAFGVLQRKFQVLVQKTELWYVGDIANVVVNCCICLHNMMVANRMAMGDEESEEFYAFPAMGGTQQSDNGKNDSDGQEDDGNNSDGQEEPEQAYVNRRVAEMNLHAELYNTNHHDERISERERQVLEIWDFNMCSVAGNVCMMPMNMRESDLISDQIVLCIQIL